MIAGVVFSPLPRNYAPLVPDDSRQWDNCSQQVYPHHETPRWADNCRWQPKETDCLVVLAVIPYGYLPKEKNKNKRGKSKRRGHRETMAPGEAIWKGTRNAIERAVLNGFRQTVSRLMMALFHEAKDKRLSYTYLSGEGDFRSHFHGAHRSAQGGVSFPFSFSLSFSFLFPPSPASGFSISRSCLGGVWCSG